MRRMCFHLSLTLPEELNLRPRRLESSLQLIERLEVSLVVMKTVKEKQRIDQIQRIAGSTERSEVCFPMTLIILTFSQDAEVKM